MGAQLRAGAARRGVTTRPADVRLYVDADLLGLGKLLGTLRNDITYPGDLGQVIHKRTRPPCPVTSPAALDADWIPIVAERGWLIITRDGRIIENRAEVSA